MRKILVLSFIALTIMGATSAQEGEDVWNHFRRRLKNDQIKLDDIKPLAEMGDAFKPTLLSFLDSIRVHASDEDWLATPEIVSVEDNLLFLVPWSYRSERVTYCFTFHKSEAKWYFRHLEAIFVRLDRYGDLPVSEFNDLPEVDKSWMRQETYWSFIVNNIYIPVSRSNGDQYALNLLKDGGGYFLAAKTWVPFLPEYRAFVLYLCWEQSNLRGNKVTLIKLDDNEALIEIESQFLALYTRSGHLRDQITYKNYISIFETIWYDRAKYSGWDLEIEYLEESRVRFKFSRQTVS